MAAAGFGGTAIKSVTWLDVAACRGQAGSETSRHVEKCPVSRKQPVGGAVVTTARSILRCILGRSILEKLP